MNNKYFKAGKGKILNVQKQKQFHTEACDRTMRHKKTTIEI